MTKENCIQRGGDDSDVKQMEDILFNRDLCVNGIQIQEVVNRLPANI